MSKTVNEEDNTSLDRIFNTFLTILKVISAIALLFLFVVAIIASFPTKKK